MSVTAGLDVGSAAVKAVVMRVGEGRDEVLAQAVARVRRRNVAQVVEEAFTAAVEGAGDAASAVPRNPLQRRTTNPDLMAGGYLP